MKYKIIYADPAWSYDKKIGQGIADDQYPTMNIKDIMELPISDMSDKDSVLFLWVTFPMLQEGLDTIRSWGFQYKTIAFNWIKLNKNGQPFFGIGHYTKSNSEICLLAIKGKGLPVLDNSVSQIIMSCRHEHSVKPKEVYQKIERLFGLYPRIELFARDKRPGWDQWGNEIPREQQNILTIT